MKEIEIKLQMIHEIVFISLDNERVESQVPKTNGPITPMILNIHFIVILPRGPRFCPGPGASIMMFFKIFSDAQLISISFAALGTLELDSHNSPISDVIPLRIINRRSIMVNSYGVMEYLSAFFTFEF